MKAAAIVLIVGGWSAHLDPARLSIEAEFGGGKRTIAARGFETPRTVVDLATQSSSISWSLKEEGLRINVAVIGGRLRVRITSAKEQTLRWPGVAPAEARALIVPVSEGLYLPSNDRLWLAELARVECFTAHGGLSLPLLGVELDNAVLSYLFSTDLHTGLCLQAEKDRIRADVSHTFHARDGLPVYEVWITVSPPSPIAPAIEYRSLFNSLTLQEKFSAVPAAKKLLGATHAYLYGDGRTIKSLDALRKLGIERAWLGYDQDETEGPFVAGPRLIGHAQKLGYLIGPYDTHDNIQDPKKADTPTSIYNAELFAGGGILNRDGRRRTGFANRGLELSSEALRRAGLYTPRVDRLAADGVDSYFLDCDSFGDLFEDFDPAHPMTLEIDRKNRLERMRYLSGHKKLVTGSESAVAWSVQVLHFSHGPHTIHARPFWNAMGDKEYFGAWRPFRRPDIFFKTIRATKQMASLHYDPAYRVPLYQAAFHQAIVSTDRWELSPIKLGDLIETRALLRLLYLVPPIWSFDRRFITEHGAEIKRHHQIFSDLHRLAGAEPLEKFAYLTEDRSVQQTRFGSILELTANFREVAYQQIPARCAEVKWLKDGRSEVRCLNERRDRTVDPSP